MFVRMILSVFLVFALAGCATGSKKQAGAECLFWRYIE